MASALLGLLGTQVVTGCSVEAEPQADVPQSATVDVQSPGSTATPSPTRRVADLPAPRLSGVAGEIERAVLAYYAARNEGQRTGTTAPYRAAYAASCDSCEAFADRLDTYYAKGQRFEGAATEVLSLRVVVGDTPGTGSADLRLRVQDYAAVDATGAVVEEYEGSEGSSTVLLGRRADGRWQVASIINTQATPSPS